MKIRICLALCAVSALTMPNTAWAKNEKTWATVSDVGLYGLSALAIGLPIAKRDKQGAFQAAGSLGAASLITTGLKEAFPERRPDGSDRKSFPSGHTSVSFAAAASLYNREGKAVGIPALAVASLVGVARVEADKHFYYDVLVGAAIGLATGFLITHDRPQRSAALIPWGDTKGGGVVLAMRF
jgi:membrane-associated phospholipid phosphatase